MRVHYDVRQTDIHIAIRVTVSRIRLRRIESEAKGLVGLLYRATFPALKDDEKIQ